MNTRRAAIPAVSALLFFAFGFVRWGVVPTTVLAFALAALGLLAYVNRPGPTHLQARQIWLGLSLAGALPVAFWLLLFVVTPVYFRVLVTTPVGWWVLAALVTAVAGTHLLVQFGVRLLTNSHPVAAGVCIAAAVVPWFASFWLIVLGPPMVILITTTPAAASPGR